MEWEILTEEEMQITTITIINDARERGVLDRVKFGSDVYKNEKPKE